MIRTHSPDSLDGADEVTLASLLSGLYASPKVSAAASRAGPYSSLAALKHALVEAVRAQSRDEQLALIRSGSKEADCVFSETGTDNRDSPDVGSSPISWTATERTHAQRLLTEYEERYGWPCVIAAGGSRGQGLPAAVVIETITRRLQSPVDVEFAECLRQIHRIAELRLNRRFGVEPALGNQVWDWAEELSAESDPGFKEEGRLTVTYLTDAHQACARRLQQWMMSCGFDEVSIDAVGNVVGIYRGSDPKARCVLTGSHYDTVRNAGKYDGRLGVLVPMMCVRELARAGRRLPFGIEVVAFAEEEGQRYKATFLGSGALTGDFVPEWLDQVDADGIRMCEAMLSAGLPADLAAIAGLRRDPARYLGFVEVHIEQGPVLNELDLPLGVVTSINGGVRYVGEIIGVASHAGTTPMGRRRDAAAAVAELVLYVERRAASVPDAVGTVGLLQVPAGSINVVPGRCCFSLDLRATTNGVRDALAADVTAELQRICTARGLSFTLERTMVAAAAPSAPEWQRRWERAVQSLGLPVFRLPSGAGHDAMKLHEVMPQAMLFVRGENAGISHNPLESTTSDDAELAVRAFQRMLDDLAVEQS